jgi:hypothetical protein
MVEFVALDAAQADRGDQFFNVGVLLEIDGGKKFDKHYFSTTKSICDKYNIGTEFKVLKSNDILKQTPSYSIPEAREEMINSILSNPAIRHIHLNIGYYKDKINPPWYSGNKKGSTFSKGWMAQLFEIITLWRYSENRYDHKIPDVAWTDDISGKICPCWSYVNNEFDLSIAPHGDSTYPSLASADILSGYLARTLPMDKDLDELPDASFGLLKGMAEDIDADIDIWAAPVNSEYENEIVPHHPYQIGGSLHYPHPMLFIYSEDFESSPGKVLSGTDFYAHARKWAFQNRGCFKMMQEHEFSNTARSGDAIAHTSEDTPRVCKSLVRVNQNKNIDVLDPNDLLNAV